MMVIHCYWNKQLNLNIWAIKLKVLPLIWRGYQNKQHATANEHTHNTKYDLSKLKHVNQIYFQFWFEFHCNILHYKIHAHAYRETGASHVAQNHDLVQSIGGTDIYTYVSVCFVHWIRHMLYLFTHAINLYCVGTLSTHIHRIN